MTERVRCHFYLRERVKDGQFFYSSVLLQGPKGDGCLHTFHPPAVGDLIYLWDKLQKGPGSVRVLARSWLHASWGSTHWPHGAAFPTDVPLLDIIVEREDGPFVDEASPGGNHS